MFKSDVKTLQDEKCKMDTSDDGDNKSIPKFLGGKGNAEPMMMKKK